MIHLTNYCMQKNSAALGRYEEGNTMSYIEFQRYIDQELGGGRQHFAGSSAGFKPVKHPLKGGANTPNPPKGCTNGSTNGSEHVDFRADVLPRIHTIIVDTILAVQSELRVGEWTPDDPGNKAQAAGQAPPANRADPSTDPSTDSSTQPKGSPKDSKRRSFELFGYDFMLDEV